MQGCSSSGGVAELPSQGVMELPEYRIGSGDRIKVDVWKNAELSSVVLVRPDGKISIPLIGDVLASQKTTDELAADLEEALKDFVRVPQVTVIVETPSSADFQRRVRVTGAVSNPLSIPFEEGMTVLDLVLQAGGLSPYASGNKARLLRKNAKGEVKSYSVRLNDILTKGKLGTNYPLAPSDVISVPERSF
ncbi:MAG: polysaccharide export protein [Gammaproteobacteria bacterium]|nr:polysaccharide export protein [Gammaproteobacteria bacterium]MBT8152134.1 polysaccharide export protein [Gammaproteobacteria bacterium]NND40353.1 sugar ABC transporter substrate-binding protein [Pseudomonadales bacterium]RZV51031.1 MAG: sugar ABC transporter substrate-binding protein [Pseudomonadales bacterium]